MIVRFVSGDMNYEIKDREDIMHFTIDFDSIRKQVDKRIPDTIVVEIVKSGRLDKIDEINKRIMKLSGTCTTGFLKLVYETLKKNQTIATANGKIWIKFNLVENISRMAKKKWSVRLC